MAHRKDQKLITSFFNQPKKKLRLDENVESSVVDSEEEPSCCNDDLDDFPSTSDCSEVIRSPILKSSDSVSNAGSSDSSVYSRDVGDFIGQKISDYTKSVLLENPWAPPQNYDFPYSTRIVSGHQKKNYVRQQHLKSYEDWLVLSHSKRGLFCKYCPWFTNRNEGGFCKNVPLKALVTEPLTNFKNLMGKEGDLEKHKTSLYHSKAVSAGKDFLNVFHNPEKEVVNRVNDQRLEQANENRARLLPIVKTIILLGRQNIPLRGHRDDGKLFSDESLTRNEGNFRALLRFRIDAGDKDLEEHLKNTSSRATYISKTTQNDIIDCCRLEITETIIDRVLNSRYYSVVFDETPDVSTKEQITLVIRYVYFGEKTEIREDFVTFVDAFQELKRINDQEEENIADDSIFHDELEPDSSNINLNNVELSLTGKNLGELVLKELKSLQLPLKNCVGIGTDGCSVMLSDIGAVREIQKTATNAIMTPCYNHKLNLSISQSSKVPVIEKTVCVIKEVTAFFSFPKRATVISGHLGKKLKRLCETRWVERHDGVLQFISNLPTIVETLEEIGKWKDKTSAGKALVLVGALCDSEFIVGLYCLSDILARTLPLSALLQKESLDLAKAGQVVRHLILDLESRRSEAETQFEDIFSKVNQMAKSLDLEIKKPRTCGRQTKRQNYDSKSPEEYFRVSVYIPLLENISTDLKTRFSEDVLDSFKLPMLLPESIIKLSSTELDETSESLINRFSNLFHDDAIVQKMKLKGELSSWKQKWIEEHEKKRLQSKPAIDVLNSCDKDIYPVLHSLLQVLCTLPASNASAERSFSSLRRLKSWTRATMVQKRLVGLALLHIHHDIDVDPTKVITRFATSKSHRFVM